MFFLIDRGAVGGWIAKVFVSECARNGCGLFAGFPRFVAYPLFEFRCVAGDDGPPGPEERSVGEGGEKSTPVAVARLSYGAITTFRCLPQSLSSPIDESQRERVILGGFLWLARSLGEESQKKAE